jgi:hypothetical protein
MKHQLFCNIFEPKYYQWRLEEAKKEYESGFELLSQMNSYSVRIAVAAMQTLSQEEQSRILPILVKMSEIQLFESMDEKMTEEEKAILQRFETAENNPDLRKKIQEQEKRFKKYPKSQLRESIKKALIEILQPVFYADIWFETQISDTWKVSTFIDFENGYGYYYSHSIFKLDERNTEIRVGSYTINLSAWLGLYPCGWLFMNNEDVEKSANTIAGLCKYFIESFKDWNLE